MGKPKGRCLKRNRAVAVPESSEIVSAPHSFVLHRGLSCPYIIDLTLDFRRMMEPFTASALKERKSNKIKDFVSLSGIFHVSHMCIFNKTKSQLSYKVARLPRGPTLTFKVHQFTLAKDIIASTKKQFIDVESFHTAPLIILNNFTGDGKHLKLMATTFQNMFPTINLATVQLSTIKRCVLISFNPVTNLIDVRHYTVTVAPIGLSRNVRKVVMGKIPNLSKCEDIADFLAAGNATDSEFEDEETGQVVLPQTLKSRGNVENNKSAVKLYEIGPRLTLELMKIEEGLFNGEILYNKQVVKTEEELKEIQLEREKKKRAKLQRRKEQEANVLAKGEQKDAHKRKSMKLSTDRNEVDTPADDDAAYYKEEIGEEPDQELFTSMGDSGGRKRGYKPKFMQNKDAKRRKLDNSSGEGDRRGGRGGDGNRRGGRGGDGDRRGGRGGGDRKFSNGKNSSYKDNKFDGRDKKFNGGNKKLTHRSKVSTTSQFKGKKRTNRK